MDIKQILIWGVKNLKTDNVSLDTSSLDAEILLSEIIKKPKEFLFSYPEKKLTTVEITKYKKFIARRKKCEPIAYIIGHKEFYGRNFIVSPDVLIPRPETETFIDVVKGNIKKMVPHTLRIIDIGIGSGAIAITLKKEFPKIDVFATEASSKAINLARKNAKTLGVKITIKKGNILAPFKLLLTSSRLPIIITANLPYLSKKEWREAQLEVKKYEPKKALIGGKNGWELYEKLFKQLCDLKINNIALIIEIGAKQKSIITKLAKRYLHPKKIEAFKDLSGKWRIINFEL